MGATHLLCLCLLVAVSTANQNQNQNLNLNVYSPAVKAITEGNERFAMDVYSILSRSQENLLVCPLSVESVLALVQTGANGVTSQQMSKALSLPEDKTQTQEAFRTLLPALQKARDVSLQTANKVYVKNSYEISNNFKNVAKNSFDADVENVDFNNAQDSSRTINDWVSQKTNSKVRNIIQPDDINAFTQLVLVNTLYFKGSWETPFESYHKVQKPFYLAGKKSVMTDVMFVTDEFMYAEDRELGCTFLEMFYKGREVSMTIVLPFEVDGLAGLERNIAKVLRKQQLTEQRVRVQMPRFAVESTIEFKKVLEELGMTVAFTDGADLRGISAKGQDLKISKVVQKTFINVTEAGTEAAAATAGSIADRIYDELPEIIIEHPFAFVIREKSSDTVLFIGKISDPTLNK